MVRHLGEFQQCICEIVSIDNQEKGEDQMGDSTCYSPNTLVPADIQRKCPENIHSSVGRGGR